MGAGRAGSGASDATCAGADVATPSRPRARAPELFSREGAGAALLSAPLIEPANQVVALVRERLGRRLARPYPLERILDRRSPRRPRRLPPRPPPSAASRRGSGRSCGPRRAATRRPHRRPPRGPRGKMAVVDQPHPGLDDPGLGERVLHRRPLARLVLLVLRRGSAPVVRRARPAPARHRRRAGRRRPAARRRRPRSRSPQTTPTQPGIMTVVGCSCVIG